MVPLRTHGRERGGQNWPPRLLAMYLLDGRLDGRSRQAEPRWPLSWLALLMPSKVTVVPSPRL